MRFKCPYCSAPFDSLGMPVGEVNCPSCGRQFAANPDMEQNEDQASELTQLLSSLNKNDAILRIALSDLYALGCWLVSTGETDIGIKVCDKALCAIPGMSDELYRWLIRGARSCPVEFARFVMPNNEITDLFDKERRRS